jgi:uncharacterized membrane protein
MAPSILRDESTVLRGAAWIPYALGGLICHQRPERSFLEGSIPWPVCARCAGLYLSAAAGVAIVLLAPAGLRPNATTWHRWRLALIVAAVPSVASWLSEAVAWWAADNATRAYLAVPFGIAVGALLASIARQTAPGHREDLR